MSLTVQDALGLEALDQVRPVAGRAGLAREVRWVHIWPEVLPWFHGGELLLTTGYSWPGRPPEQRRIVRELAEARLAAILFTTGRFFPRIPRAILEAAERVSLPILEAPSDIAFAEVTEIVNREIIRRQYSVIERSEQIHRHLTAVALEAKELGDICQALASLIKKPVAIVDPSFHPLARSDGPGHGGPPSDAEWFSTDRLERSGRRDILEEIRRARGPTRVSGRGDPASRDRIVCPIRLAGEPVGYLWVLEGTEPLMELDLRAAEHGAVVAALHILRQQAVATVEARVQNSFVQALIQGEFGKIAGLEERARLLGFNPEESYVVGLLALVGDGGRKRALAGPEEFRLRERLDRALRLGLRESGFPVLLGYLMNQVVFLLPGGARQPALEAKVTALWKRIRAQEPAIPCAMALGGIHAGATGVAASHADADSVLVASEGEGVFWYHHLTLVRLLRSVNDRQVLCDLYDRTLARLRRARQGEALCETVKALIRHAFNQRAAARAMATHWNTMRHRIARIEDILQRPLADPELRLHLQLAAEIERVLPVTPDPRRQHALT